MPHGGNEAESTEAALYESSVGTLESVGHRGHRGDADEEALALPPDEEVDLG
jgi:hypothetical protein